MRNVIALGIVIAVSGLLFLGLGWAFVPWLPYRRLPRHRVRHLRLRLWLRLHPGHGHATLPELWLRWGRHAAFRRSGRARASLPFWERALRPASTYSIRLGRAHLRHGLRLPVEEHGAPCTRFQVPASDLGGADSAGLVARLENRIGRLEEHKVDALAAVQHARQEITHATESIGQPYPHATELARARDRARQIDATAANGGAFAAGWACRGSGGSHTGERNEDANWPTSYGQARC